MDTLNLQRDQYHRLLSHYPDVMVCHARHHCPLPSFHSTVEPSVDIHILDKAEIFQAMVRYSVQTVTGIPFLF